ncbi:MAG: hypothetical protein ACOH1T_04220 [Microbacteriaceae bacterium]
MSRARAVTRKVLLIVGGVVVVGALSFVAVFIIGNVLFANEMACEEGKAPATTTDGGSACFDEGSVLPAGFTWDPRGNYKIN